MSIFEFNGGYLGRVDFLIDRQSSNLTDSEHPAAYGDLVFYDTIKNSVIIETCAWTRPCEESCRSQIQ